MIFPPPNSTVIYKVRFRKDNEYEVITHTYTIEQEYNREPVTENVFQGSLADCEAYIRLKEGGYLE